MLETFYQLPLVHLRIPECLKIVTDPDEFWRRSSWVDRGDDEREVAVVLGLGQQNHEEPLTDGTATERLSVLSRLHEQLDLFDAGRRRPLVRLTLAVSHVRHLRWTR